MRCPVGSVKIGKRLALSILEWHGGQTAPSYAVGSSGFAGRCVAKPLVKEAARELRLVLHDISKKPFYSGFSKKQLASIVNTLTKKGA